MELEDRIKSHIAAVLNQPSGRLRDDTPLSNLVCDSFILVDLVIELQEEFDVLLAGDDLKGLSTVADLVGLIGQRADVLSPVYPADRHPRSMDSGSGLKPAARRASS